MAILSSSFEINDRRELQDRLCRISKIVKADVFWLMRTGGSRTNGKELQPTRSNLVVALCLGFGKVDDYFGAPIYMVAIKGR